MSELSEDVQEEYPVNYFDTSLTWYGYAIGKHLRDTTVTVRYPFLMGAVKHVSDMPPGHVDTVFHNAKLEPAVGTVTSKTIEADSTWKITDSYYDSASHQFYIEEEYFDGYETEYSYEEDQSGNPISHLPKTITKRCLSTDSTITWKLGHDSYGNVDTVYDEFSESDPLYSYTYDNTHTFRQTIETRDGLVSYIYRDPYTGLTLKRTAFTGQSEWHLYDGCDRLTHIKLDSASSFSNVAIHFDSAVPFVLIDSVLVDSTSSLYRVTKREYDIWGNAWRTSRYGFSSDSSSTSCTLWEYDRQGRLRKAYRPYYSAPGASIMYAYDYLGRPIEIDYPDIDTGEDTSYNVAKMYYFQREVTNEDWLGRYVKESRDKYKRLVCSYRTSTDSSAWLDSTRFEYLGISSLPTQITDPAGASVTYTYDCWRRPRSVTRPDQGTTYTYFDEFGNLRFTKDARGIWTIFSYDSLFRVTRIGTADTLDTTKLNDLDYQPESATVRAVYHYGGYNFDLAEDTLKAYYEAPTIDSVNSYSWIKSKLTQVDDETGTSLFVYDRLGRIVCKYIYFDTVFTTCKAGSCEDTIAISPKIIDYEYNAMNQVVRTRYPHESSSWFSYKYYPSGLTKDIDSFTGFTLPGNDFRGFTYTAWGAVEAVNTLDSTNHEYYFDNLSRVSGIVNYSFATSDTLYTESYRFNAHQLSEVFADLSFSTKIREYEYDYRDRLTHADYCHRSHGTVEQYWYYYDKANNRDSVTYCALSCLTKTTSHYHYENDSYRLKNYSSIDGDTATKYVYDAAGNTLVDLMKGHSYSYDYRNVIDTLFHESILVDTMGVHIDTILFAYNYKNQRVMKLSRYWYEDDCEPQEDTLPGGGSTKGSRTGGGGDPQCPFQRTKATIYVWSGNEVVAEYDIDDALADQYVHANGMRLVRINNDPATGERDTLFSFHDYQGSRRLTIDKHGAIKARLSYDAWGSVRTWAGDRCDGYLYTGQERDDYWLGGLYYYRNRYYDADIGRFTTPDPILSDYSPYTYCRDNPVMFVDPFGLDIVGISMYIFNTLLDPTTGRLQGVAGSSQNPIIVDTDCEAEGDALYWGAGSDEDYWKKEHQERKRRRRELSEKGQLQDGDLPTYEEYLANLDPLTSALVLMWKRTDIDYQEKLRRMDEMTQLFVDYIARSLDKALNPFSVERQFKKGATRALRRKIPTLHGPLFDLARGACTILTDEGIAEDAWDTRRTIDSIRSAPPPDEGEGP